MNVGVLKYWNWRFCEGRATPLPVFMGGKHTAALNAPLAGPFTGPEAGALAALLAGPGGLTRAHPEKARASSPRAKYTPYTKWDT